MIMSSGKIGDMKEIEKRVWESLKGVIDPELKTSVVDAGLIKRVEERDGVAYIDMVLTTPFCPIADLLASCKESC